MCEYCHESESCRQMRIGKMLVWVCKEGNCGKKWLAEHANTA